MTTFENNNILWEGTFNSTLLPNSFESTVTILEQSGGIYRLQRGGTVCTTQLAGLEADTLSG